MKKRISSILATVVAACALVASVGAVKIAPVADASDYVLGDTVTVTITAQDIAGAEVNDGVVTLTWDESILQYASHEDGVGMFNSANGKIAFASAAALTEGKALLTINFLVVGEGDGALSVTGEGFDDAATTVAAAAEVEEPTEPTTEIEDTYTEDTYTEDTYEEEDTYTEDTYEEDTYEEETFTETEEPGVTEEPTVEEPAEEVPATGVALAVVPVALAAAAAIVSKKRK